MVWTDLAITQPDLGTQIINNITNYVHGIIYYVLRITLFCREDYVSIENPKDQRISILQWTNKLGFLYG